MNICTKNEERWNNTTLLNREETFIKELQLVGLMANINHLLLSLIISPGLRGGGAVVVSGLQISSNFFILNLFMKDKARLRLVLSLYSLSGGVLWEELILNNWSIDQYKVGEPTLFAPKMWFGNFPITLSRNLDPHFPIVSPPAVSFFCARSQSWADDRDRPESDSGSTFSGPGKIIGWSKKIYRWCPFVSASETEIKDR